MKYIVRYLAYALVFCISAATVSAQMLIEEKEKKGIIYRLYADGHAGVAGLKDFSKYKDYKIELVDFIKHKGQRYPVTEIEDNAFEGAEIKLLTWPSVPLERIGKGAFRHCNFEAEARRNFVISAKKVDWKAFELAGIGQVRITGDVKEINPQAFSQAPSFEVDSTNTNYYSAKDNYFSAKGALIEKQTGRLLFSSNGFIPKGVKIIGSNSLYAVDERCLEIPSGVELIEEGALTKAYKLEEIYVLTNRPPVLRYQGFSDKWNNSLRVYVPEEALYRYSKAPGWNKFYWMKDISDENWKKQIDQPYYLHDEFDPDNYSDIIHWDYKHPYIALRSAEIAHIRAKWSNEFAEREMYLRNQRYDLKYALEMFRKESNPANPAEYHFAIGRIWQMISRPWIMGGAFEDSDDDKDAEMFASSFQNALEAYEKAAGAGSVAALREMGRMWLFGWSNGGSGGGMIDERYAPDSQKGMSYLNKAIDGGDGEAALIAGEFGPHVYTSNPWEEQIRYYEKAVELGYKDAPAYLANTYFYKGMSEASEAMAKKMTKPERQELFRFVADAVSSNPRNMIKGADYFRNGPIEYIDFEKSKATYKAVSVHADASAVLKAEALYKYGELEFWINPYSPKIEVFKQLATKPEYSSTEWGEKAKVWLGTYYDDVVNDHTTAVKWYNALSPDMNDLDCVATLANYYPQSPLLKRWADTSRYYDVSLKSPSPKADWLYYRSLGLGEKSSEVEQVPMAERYMESDSWIFDPEKRYAEEILVAHCNYTLNGTSKMSTLKKLCEKFGTPRLKTVYGKALVLQGKNTVKEGLRLMEEGVREASYYDDECGDLGSWRINAVAFLAQLYDGDPESWGSDALYIPKHASDFRDPLKAIEYKTLCNKIDWKGPSGW